VTEQLLFVAEIADYLRTSQAWVRRHQAELGGFRLGNGKGRNPIRFRREDVDAYLERHRLRPPPTPSNGDWRNDPDWAVR
jgi:Helix-turn-helix domain